MTLTLSQTTNLRLSKLKEFANDNFKFDGYGRKMFKRVENTMVKGEIARNEQFSFSHSVFKRLVLQARKNQGLFGKRLRGGLLRETIPSNMAAARFKYNT